MNRSVTGNNGNRLDILHVSEAYGGGIQSAVNSYIQNSPRFRHQVLVRKRDGHDIGLECSANEIALTGSLPIFLLAARSYILRARPRIVHLHSSFAGLLRFFDFGSDVHVIYTPHAYAFLRRDYSPPLRFIFRTIERILSKRAQTIAAISPFEAASAARMAGSSARVTYLPNVASNFNHDDLLHAALSQSNTVVMAGRISPQKDPLFFAQTAMSSSRAIHWIWLGDGDADLRAALIAAGVVVTGWLPNHELRRQVAGADLYLHTASWEGAPITPLEAAAVGTPVLVRGVASLRGLSYEQIEDSPHGAVKAIDQFFADNEYRNHVIAATAESVRVHSVEAQSHSLNDLYRNIV